MLSLLKMIMNIEKLNINRQDTGNAKDIKQQATKCEEGTCQTEH